MRIHDAAAMVSTHAGARRSTPRMAQPSSAFSQASPPLTAGLSAHRPSTGLSSGSGALSTSSTCFCADHRLQHHAPDERCCCAVASRDLNFRSACLPSAAKVCHMSPEIDLTFPEQRRMWCLIAHDFPAACTACAQIPSNIICSTLLEINHYEYTHHGMLKGGQSRRQHEKAERGREGRARHLRGSLRLGSFAGLVGTDLQE